MGACALIAMALMLALGACTPLQEEEPKVVEVKPLVPVDLPAVPSDLGQSVTPEKHSDGSLTIDGLRRNRRAHLDKDVTVKGFIVWNYECPYEEEIKKRRKRRKKKKEGEEEEEQNLCQRAHFYIADQARSDERLLVVGVTPFFEERFEDGDLKVGEQYTFHGRYADLGDGFAAPEEGLLALVNIDGIEQEEDDKKKK